MDWNSLDLVNPPTADLVEEFAKQWESGGSLGESFIRECSKNDICVLGNEKIFENIFDVNSKGDKKLEELYTTHPENTDENIVLLKILLLDKLYSTQIKDPIGMAEYIVKKSLYLPREDHEINTHMVDNITMCTSRKEYSFATKFCHWHNANYPIYDDIVAHMLIKYNDLFKFSGKEKLYIDSTKQKDCSLRVYETYLTVYRKFIEYFFKDNNDITLKKIDIFLWSYGKFLNKVYNTQKTIHTNAAG